VTVEVEVDEAGRGMRLDVFFGRRVEGVSRTVARRLIQDGEVRLNGRRVRKGQRLAVGDIVTYTAPPPNDFVPVAQPGSLPLSVVHEDAQVVVVNKPARLPTHPLRFDETRTLVNALLHRYPEMEGVGYALREPGIVHRLDNDTSGLLIAARDVDTFNALRSTLRAGKIRKHYDVLVEGVLEAGEVLDAPIAKHPSDPRRVHVCLAASDRRRGSARSARTELLQAERVGEGFTKLRVSASVAVRHQIRAHLAARGHPLVGDWLYGGAHHDTLGRHFLHAGWVAFEHPRTREEVALEADLPSELAGFVSERL